MHTEIHLWDVPGQLQGVLLSDVTLSPAMACNRDYNPKNRQMRSLQ